MCQILNDTSYVTYAIFIFAILMFSNFKPFGRFQDVIYFHFTKSDAEILEILEVWRRSDRHKK